ncbi:hypothetical protein LTR08_004799 [Meristemomyces frigidus]|nr:hypothetical protein LTR08_004799 [Meristemomyces frigidus]
MPSNSTIVDVTYDDPRTGQRIRERRVQEIPYEELETVRDRELALVRVPRDREITRYREGEGRYDREEYPVERVVSRRVRERRDDEGYLPPRQSYDERNAALASYPRRGEGHDRRSSRRREPAAYSDSESESSRERRRRRRHRRGDNERSGTNKREDNERKLLHDIEKRREGNFVQRNFDSSLDGIIAGVAGAAMGAIAAQRFAGDKQRRLKTVAGAVVGAAALNSGENWYRLYTEEEEEKKEEAVDVKGPLEGMGLAAEQM